MVDCIGSHVDLLGEREIVVDLAPLHRPEVEVKALQVEDEIVRYILETRPIPTVSEYSTAWDDIH
jgi:hypothetical protein